MKMAAAICQDQDFRYLGIIRIGRNCSGSGCCHCEERSDVAIPLSCQSRLPNDSLNSNEIAALRSQ